MSWAHTKLTLISAALAIRAPVSCVASANESWNVVRGGRQAARDRILEINAEQVFTFGLVAQIPQPVVVRNGLHNLPETAIYNWNPGAQFGVYRPETFWIEEAARQ